jgi:hypothetical protein
MVDISKMLTAEQLSDKLNGKLKRGRITELAQSKLIPHYEFEGEVLFKYTESKKWIEENLLVPVDCVPIPMSLAITPIIIRPEGYDTPDVLKGLSTFLLPLQIQSLKHASFSGVYFLCFENDVVYVGQSKDVSCRVGAHMGVKEFDFAFCLRVPKSDLNFVESEFIMKLQPKYNYGKTGILHRPARCGYKHESSLDIVNRMTWNKRLDAERTIA